MRASICEFVAAAASPVQRQAQAGAPQTKFYRVSRNSSAVDKRLRLEEAGVETLKDDKIRREQFFYDGER